MTRFFRIFTEVFAPKKPQTLAELASGLCVLPKPRQPIEKPIRKKSQDIFVIDEERNEFGFHQATSTRQTEGSQSDLTGYDIRLLKERGYWGMSAKGRATNDKNAACKQCWHTGKTEKEAATQLKVSVSWIEKRYGSFTTALSEEQNT